MSISGCNILNQTYRCTKLSPTTCDLYASSVSTLFPSSVLHTKLCRRLSRFVTAFDGASSPSTMASAKVRASDSRLCAPFSSTSFTPSVSMRRQYKDKSRLGRAYQKKENPWTRTTHAAQKNLSLAPLSQPGYVHRRPPP
jgi:hypothetical protein